MVPTLQMKKLRPREIINVNMSYQTKCSRGCGSSIHHHLACEHGAKSHLYSAAS